MVTTVEFGNIQAARKIRNDPRFKGFLASSDVHQSKTVTLKDGTPEDALTEITGEAADSKSHEADKAGQVELTRRERREIDFSREGMDIPTARSIKAVALNEGVSDWMSYSDFDLTVDENRQILSEAAKEDRGVRGLGRDMDSEASIDQRLGRAYNRQQEEELDRAKDFGLVEGDTEAQEFLTDRGSDFDIGFNRRDNRLVGQGEDFNRLEQRHESRSSRAQTMDEKRTAPTTRDPVQWTNNPNEYDYPGIDTVQPQELHEQRSERAQKQDEREIAPTADSKEQWANNQDRYDWPGVDRPESYGPTMDRTAPNHPEEEKLSDPSYQTQGTGLAPEDLDGTLSGSREMSATNNPFGLAGGEQADMAFTEAERERTQGSEFTDDRPQQDSLLSHGMETDATQHRESREDVESASVFGVDDRSEDALGSDESESEQEGLEIFGGGKRENETLF